MTEASVGSSYRTQYTFLHHSKTQAVQAQRFQVSHLEGDAASADLSLSNKHLQTWSSPKTGLLQVKPSRADVISVTLGETTPKLNYLL